jgi:hypothetical protein
MPEDTSLRVAGVSTKEQAPAVVLDSLPYVDEVHEDYEQYALALIEEEMKRIHPPKGKSLPPLKLHSEMLQNDYKNLSQNPDQIPELDFDNRAKEPSESTVEAWRGAVKEARAEYEAERQRSTIMEIEKTEASTQQWKLYNGTLLESIQKKTLQEMEAQRDSVDRINAERQQQQEAVGQTLHLLNAQWHGAIQKRSQLQVAIQNLEQEVESLRQQTNSTTTQQE